MSNQKIVTETALSTLASDIKTALSGKANSNDVYLKSQTYNRTEIDNALDLKADKSELYNVYPTDQESGAIAHFTDGADNIPVKSLVSEIVAVESGNGQPKSPSNPYSISGFANGVVGVCGVNVWDEVWELNSGRVSSKNYIPVKPNTKYFLNSTLMYYARMYDINKTLIGSASYVAKPNGFELTMSADCYYFKFEIANSYGTTYNHDISLNYPSTDTQYHAYNGNTYTFTFGQTVYGGHFDNNGNLVITHGYHEITGTENWAWAKSGTYSGGFYTPVASVSAKANTPFICTHARTVTSISNYEWGTCYCDGSLNFRIMQASDTVDDWKTYLANQYANGTPVAICYELANPITLSITSQDIPTLLGENNIFSNCGDVEVNYHADIGLYIDKKISSLAQA